MREVDREIDMMSKFGRQVTNVTGSVEEVKGIFFINDHLGSSYPLGNYILVIINNISDIHPQGCMNALVFLSDCVVLCRCCFSVLLC